MSAPIMTPRAEQIAEDLLRDAQAFLAETKDREDGPFYFPAEERKELRSRQIRAVIKATARHLAGLEAVLQQRTKQKP